MIELKNSRNRVLIKPETKEVMDEIRARFTIPNKAVRYSPHASLTLSPITPLGSFQIGMFKEIYEALEELFPEEEIIVEDSILKAAFPRIRKTSKDRPLTQAENTGFVYRDYQQSAVEAALDGGRGVVLLPTRSGKSLVMYGVFLNMKTRLTLIVVPNIQLVKQMHGDFIDYGCDKNKVQVFSGYSHKIEDKEGIIITNTQYLLKHSEEIPKFDTLVIDECLRKGTLIKTDKGDKKIEDIVIGDKVYSYNIEQDVYEYKQVSKCHKNLSKSNSFDFFLEIQLENNKILMVTPNHKIYTTNRGYVRADELNNFDNLLIF
jgi:reverse gyrase